MMRLALIAALWGAAPGIVQWSATDIEGQSVTFPAERSAVVLFVRPDQRQSETAIEQVQAIIGELDDVMVIAVVSGAEAALRAHTAKLPFRVVADPDFAASGAMNVHAWPSTVIVGPDGAEILRIAGMSSLYAKTVAAHIELARGKIDRAQLDERLATNDVVTASTHDMASRHLKVAQRMMDRGLFRHAVGEINKGLEIEPDQPQLLLAKAIVHTQMAQPREAIDTLDRIPDGAAPDWQLAAVRGRALVLLERYDEAVPILQSAARLNPKPSEVYYLLGIAHLRQQRWADAAAAFRRAFETTEQGRNARIRD
jgi:tetratricopeptide (TPR) repeat protein